MPNIIKIKLKRIIANKMRETTIWKTQLQLLQVGLINKRGKKTAHIAERKILADAFTVLLVNYRLKSNPKLWCLFRK
jgi:hypothetical protein